MSIKGFPSQKKLIKKLNNYDDSQSHTRNEFVTAQPSYSDKILLDTVNSNLARLHAVVKTAEANTNEQKRILVSTAHGAAVGDVIRFELASANPFFEATIISLPDANTIILGAELPNNIVTGDEFFILRHTTPRVNQDGSGIVSLAPSPILFSEDGVDTEVSQDTAVPANSKPLPVRLLDIAGVAVDYATQATQLAIEVAVTLISDAIRDVGQVLDKGMAIGGQDENGEFSFAKVNLAGEVLVKSNANGGGSYDEGLLIGISDVTVVAPANAVGFILTFPSTNTDACRWAIGTTASDTIGTYYEAGRDTGFVPCAANISICATVAGTNGYHVQWITRS